MKKRTFFLVMIAFCLLASFGLPKNIQKKVNKVLKDVFEIETFQLEALKIDKELNKLVPTKIGENNLFKISNGTTLLGYAYIGKAPSKTADFDYLVIFDENLIIERAKVLIYREEYGGEIGSKRWLKQFIGKSETDELEFRKNIMAISGATISVRSMTNAINDLLKTIGILHEKKIL